MTDRRFERAALEYAARGYHVFPCKARGKEPLTPNGWHDATRDERTILQWWDRWPDANIGVACGPSGIGVADMDSKAGADPRELLPAFDGYPVVWTGEAPEPSPEYPNSLPDVRGAHVYFRAQLATCKTKLAGVEIRGAGAYVIAPPSVHPSGVPYEGDVPAVADLPEAPAGLADFLIASSPASAPVPEDDERLAQGNRHEGLLAWARSRLTARGILGPVALDAMRGHNARVCVPPLEDAEVVRLWKHLEGSKIAASERAKAARVAPRADPGPAEPATPTPAGRPWPAPLADAAFHGLAGRFVRTVAPHSEADPVALLVQLLVGFGNLIGRGPGWRVEADFHATNEFAILVGDTAKARKGLSWGRVRQLLDQVDDEWTRGHVVDGLASGEGLVWHVRDPITKRRKAKKNERADADADGFVTITEDAGVTDKRVLIHEPEFAHVLNVIAREKSTLSPTLRALWETGNRNGLTKNDPTRTTGAHVSVIGHITAAEFRAHLTTTEQANGFANRFLIVCVRRARFLPFGGNLEPGALGLVAAQFREAVDYARTTKTLSWSLGAQLWDDVYADLSTGAPGLFGAITARAEPHVMRLAVIYALLDKSKVIDLPHLEAALAVWRYCEESAAYVFSGTVGHPLADRLLALMRNAGASGITRGELRDAVSHKIGTTDFNVALGHLRRLRLATVERQPSGERGGRPREIWFATQGEETRSEGEETGTPEDSSPVDPVSSPLHKNAFSEGEA